GMQKEKLAQFLRARRSPSMPFRPEPGRTLEHEMIDEVRPLGHEPGREIPAEGTPDQVAGTADRPLDELGSERGERLHRFHRGMRGRGVEAGRDRHEELERFRELVQHLRPADAPGGMEVDDRPPVTGGVEAQLARRKRDPARVRLHQRSLTCGRTRSRNSSMPRRMTSSRSVPTFTVKLNTPWPSSEWMRLICFTTVSGLPHSTVPRSICSSSVSVLRLSSRLFQRSRLSSVSK